MSRIRWIPAKATLGQAAPMISAPVSVQEQPVPGNKGVFEKVFYGGLILAGAVAFITFVFGKD